SMRLSSTDTLPSLATFRHTEPAKLKKLVRGELDWIVMKALEKHRTRRYETTSGLARDIQRYLDDEVVEARPPSTGYRFGKFVRRHRGQVIAAGLVLLALLAGVVGTTWGLIREARAKTRLAESLDREQNVNADLSAANVKVKARYDLAVEAVKTFHTGVSEDFLLKEEKFKDLRNRLLKSASDFYGKLGALLGTETDIASRRALAESNFELAKLTRKVGRPHAALAAHQAVLAAREALAAEPTADTATKADVGRSLNEVASLLDATGKTGEALAAYRRSESLLANLVVSDPAALATLAACRSRIGQILFSTDKKEEALTAYRLARADQETLAAAPAASNDVRRELADTVRRIAFLFLYYSDVSNAEAEYRTALAIRQKLSDQIPTVTEFTEGLAIGHNNLATALVYADKPTEALANSRSALAIWQKLVAENPAVTQFRSGLAASHLALGRQLCTAGRPADAEAEYEKALAILEKLVDENPAVTQFRSGLAEGHRGLGTLLLQTGEPRRAEAECRKGLALTEVLVADNPTSLTIRNAIPFHRYHLADVLRSLGRMVEAKDLYDRAIAHAEPPFLKNSTDPEYAAQLMSAVWRRALTRRELGDPAGAAGDARRAVRLCEVLPPRYSHYLVETVCAHAALAAMAGQVGSGVSAAEGNEAARQAMEWLGRAVAVGYRNANQLRVESALDPLRDRADFKKLMAELEKHSPAQQEKK
ncbi:MAG: hypothetical protein ACLQIB_42680, partial [Isosphaeraceae bacterium]